MNRNLLLIGLLIGALFFLRRPKARPEPGLIGVNTQQAGFGGFDADDPW